MSFHVVCVTAHVVHRSLDLDSVCGDVGGADVVMVVIDAIT